MKKKYFLIVALLLSIGVRSQTINFPDPVFKARLLASGALDQVALSQNGTYLVLDSNGDNQIQVSEVQNVYTLNLNTAGISDLTGIGFFTNLRTLNCFDNELTSLNLSPLTNLEAIRASGNQLTALDLSAQPNMKMVFVQDNQLAALNLQGLMNLELVTCQNNQLTALQIADFSHIYSFNCSHNAITSLAVHNASNYIYMFNCSYNQLQSLQFTGTNNITDLTASYNALTSVDLSALSYTEHVDLAHNHLSQIVFPDMSAIVDFYLSYNELTEFSMETTGNMTMQNINLDHNLITSVDYTLHTSNSFSLGNFALNNNPLAHLEINITGSGSDDFRVTVDEIIPDFKITGGIYGVSVINSQAMFVDLSRTEAYNIEMLVTPNLRRLNLKNGVNNALFTYDNAPLLEYVCADESELQGITQNLFSMGHFDIPLNSYCSFTPGGEFYVIEGSTRFNGSGNCAASDPVYPNLRFEIADGTISGSMIADQTGHYSIPVQLGAHTITPVLENPTYFSVSPASTTVNFPADATPSIHDFCISPVGFHPDVEVVIVPLTGVRPGFEALYKVVYTNKGNTIESGTIDFLFGNTISFTSASETTSAQMANSVSFAFTNLQLFESREIIITMLANAPTAQPALNDGDTLHFEATIDTGNIDPGHAILNQTAVNAMDPNDKTCLEGQTISTAAVGGYVHYQIRFENTGSAEAVNIIVVDMIDLTKFDIASLVPIDGSHNFYTRINGNKVEFIFENINLPFDDTNNDGYIAFKIKTKPTLAVGDTFSNAASIYFDYNHPIVTEPAVTTISVLKTKDFEFSDYFTIYPNPANDVLNIQSKNNIEITSAEIYNTLGQLVIAVTNSKEVSKIDVSNLAAGNYFIRIHSDKGTTNTKFAKK